MFVKYNNTGLMFYLICPTKTDLCVHVTACRWQHCSFMSMWCCRLVNMSFTVSASADRRDALDSAAGGSSELSWWRWGRGWWRLYPGC